MCFACVLGLAPTSRNHAIEFHSEVIEHAEAKLDSFIATSPSFDEYEFCPPLFLQGQFAI